MGPKRQKLALFAAVSAYLFVFLKNAWVGEDAYIIFRSIEQLFAGNGPRWNPHERVQVFTNPLWYGVLSVFRQASADVFLNAIVASAIASLVLIIILNAIFHDNAGLLLAVMILLCSTAFFDYTTSGLENPIVYVLLALFFLYYHKLTTASPEQFRRKFLIKLLVSFGLILLCRHDLITLVLIPTIYICWSYRRALAPKIWFLYLSVALSPLLIWSLFALLYYGSVFPNTFYAKLPSNVDRFFMWKRGVVYFLVSLRYDTITLFIIAFVLLCSLLSRRKSIAVLGTGIVLNLIYIVYVGGDFMQGRFLSYAYLVAVLMLMTPGMWEIDGVRRKMKLRLPRIASKIRAGFAILFVGSLLYMIFFPHTPVNSPLDYRNEEIIKGVDDERGYFFETSSLWQYLTNNTGVVFPKYAWSEQGYNFKISPRKIQVMHAIGYFGYWAGTEKIIVDPLGLGDPLLARLPKNGWLGQVGHFTRKIPAGYQQSILDESARLNDPDLNEYYKKIRIVTQDPKLFTLKRIKTIIGLNFGIYNHYLRKEYQEEQRKMFDD